MSKYQFKKVTLVKPDNLNERMNATIEYVTTTDKTKEKGITPCKAILTIGDDSGAIHLQGSSKPLLGTSLSFLTFQGGSPKPNEPTTMFFVWGGFDNIKNLGPIGALIYLGTQWDIISPFDGQ